MSYQGAFVDEFEDIRRTQEELQEMIDRVKADHARLRTSLEDSVSRVEVVVARLTEKKT